MKEKGKELFYLILATIFLPYVMTVLISGTSGQREMKKSGILIEYDDGKKVDLEEFLPYMIAAQISLDSEMETLKAQAVIARTNLMRELGGKTETKSSELTIPFLASEQFDSSFGEAKRKEMMKKLQKAVSDTCFKTIKQGENYIEALYHAVSIGTTVSSQEIYGKERVYLQEVESSQDVESEEYMTTVKAVPSEVLGRLQKAGKAKTQTIDTIFTSIRVMEKTANGYVKKIAVGEDTMSGEEWKNLFALNSTNFYLEEREGTLLMIVLGKGHGVGMSQYGADALAKEGWTYEEIIKKYYPGTEIV